MMNMGLQLHLVVQFQPIAGELEDFVNNYVCRLYSSVARGLYIDFASSIHGCQKALGGSTMILPLATIATGH